MAKKTYRTYHLKKLYTFVRDAEGNRINIEFRGGIQIDSTSRFTTSDPQVQKGLESAPGFGRDYYIEYVVENAPVAEAPAAESEKKEKAAPKKKEEPLTDVKDIKRFRNIVEMRNYMKEIGIAIPDDCSYTDAKAAAKKEGYDFQIKR